jgi:signal transduction histidine kinase/ActR/RegA family two-component response regulator
VLIPVIVVMATLVITTVWVLNQRIVHQLETEGTRRLETAEAIFQNSQKIHANGLLLRYRNIVNEPRFIAISQLADPKTMQSYLTKMLDELNVDALVYTTAAGQRLAGVSRDSNLKLTEFASDSPSIQQAWEGRANAGISFAGQRLFDVVSVPVNVDNSNIGVVTFGVEIGDAAAQEFQQLAHSEIAFVVNNHIVASTLPATELRGPLESLLAGSTPHGNGNTANSGPAVRKAIVENEHFLCSIGLFPSATGRFQPAYMLLSSYEQPLRALRDTQHVLAWVGIVGVALGSLVVWVLVRRITQPLRQLRDSAEAVGRGDFSKRVVVESRDECGELAEAFNRMTQNIEASRDQLEMTVETLKSTKAQLTQSEKLSVIGEFVAGVAHELNNPLASVIGFSQLLQRGHFDADQQHYVDRVVSESRRCQKIVHNLLSFARQSQPERTWIDVNQLVRSSLDILEYQLRTSNIDATAELDPHLPGVMGDSHQLQQVFVNILNNARQALEPHRPQGGRLRITTRTNAGRVEVLFSDNGPGIEEANLSKIFTPFFTTKEVGKGTGLGLSLCYGIIHEHGGSIRVESKFGEGATFIVELPVAEGAPANLSESDASGTSAQSQAQGTGKRVLVVDDEEALRDLLSVVLTADHYDVDTASDGDTALRKTKSAHYDLIVSDWKMPGLNGYELYQQVRATDPAMAARFVFLTGDVIGAQKLLNNSDGICLAKPFQVDDLRATVNRLCATSQAS